MGKIVLLVPREEMLYQAHNILQEKKYAVSDMRVIPVSYTHLQVLLTLKVDGSTKGNIKVYLPMQYRPRVIRMAGFLVIVSIRETIMTAEALSSCMTR